jgi:hypothetical protein
VATGRNSIRNKAKGGNRPDGTQGLGAGRSEATTRALEFEEWWDTPPEAVFKPRQRVSRDGQQGQTGKAYQTGIKNYPGQGQIDGIFDKGKNDEGALGEVQSKRARPVVAFW